VTEEGGKRGQKVDSLNHGKEDCENAKEKNGAPFFYGKRGKCRRGMIVGEGVRGGFQGEEKKGNKRQKKKNT